MRVKSESRFYNFKRPKIRASWNKRNLYNLWRMEKQQPPVHTFFQQKHKAKQVTRAYHGEQINEKKWERMFSRYIPAVVEMDARQLAQQDGGEQSAGTGAGRQGERNEQRQKPKQGSGVMTPYMHMTYWTQERRLDTAIFRAMLATSVRQARQMVLHGHVKVNGNKFTHPSYLLNPGDMFSVDPVQVLAVTAGTKWTIPIAAGLWKKCGQGTRLRPRVRHWLHLQKGRRARSLERERAQLEGREFVEYDDPNDAPPLLEAFRRILVSFQERLDEMEGELEQVLNAISESQINKKQQGWDAPPLDDAAIRARRKMILAMYKRSKQVEKDKLPRAKQKQALRSIRQELSRSMARPWLISDQSLKDYDSQLDAISSAIDAQKKARNEADAASTSTDAEILKSLKGSAIAAVQESQQPKETLSEREAHMRALARITGPRWVLRPYVGPFAFIPRYLEVNHTVCSAVYLRHPVARLGISEIPSPFPLETANLAFTWYLRRR